MTDKQYLSLVSKINELSNIIKKYDIKTYRLPSITVIEDGKKVLLPGYTFHIKYGNYVFINNLTGEDEPDKKRLLYHYSRKKLLEFIKYHLYYEYQRIERPIQFR